MCAKLREKGFAPICWFTGGKGVRVAWFDPACYMRYRKGDKDVSARVRDVFFKDYLGADCLAQIRALCELDKCVYEAGKGVKSDLRRHQDTGFWPFLMDFGDADEGFRSMCAKRETRDEALCDQIVAFWSRVLTNLPESWDAANTVPGGAKAIADVGGGAKKRHRDDDRRASRRRRSRGSWNGCRSSRRCRARSSTPRSSGPRTWNNG